MYRKSHLRAVSQVFGIVLASLVPAAAILTLYFIRHSITRLVVLLVYSGLFSVCLAFFTSAQRIEIFAGKSTQQVPIKLQMLTTSATAAFAGVQVVFVGSSIGSGGLS